MSVAVTVSRLFAVTHWEVGDMTETLTLTEFITQTTSAVANYGVFIAGGFVLGAIGYLVRKLSKSGR